MDLLGSNVETAALFMWIRLDQKIGHLVQIDLLGAKSRVWLPRLDGSAWIIKWSGGPIPGTTGAAIPSLYSQHTLGSSHLHLIENYTALPTALVYIYIQYCPFTVLYGWSYCSIDALHRQGNN